MSHGKLREEAAHLLAAELVGGAAANKSLKLAHPKAVGSQGFAGVVPELDTPFQVAVFEKWPQARGRTWRMAVFVAEIEVEAGPLVVVRALERRHPTSLQPPLVGYPGFSGNLLHGIMNG